MKLTLPYPPSGNRYWRHYKNRVVRSAEATHYINRIRWTHHDIEPLSGELKITLTLYRPQRSGDLDNFLKVLLDALQGVAYENDKQVVEIHAFRKDDKQNPRAEVTIEQTTEN